MQRNRSLQSARGSSCTKRRVAAAMSGFIPEANKAGAHFEQKTPPSVSMQTLVTPDLGAARSITSAATLEKNGRRLII